MRHANTPIREVMLVARLHVDLLRVGSAQCRADSPLRRR